MVSAFVVGIYLRDTPGSNISLVHYWRLFNLMPRSLLSLRELKLSHDIEGERKPMLGHDVILAHVFREDYVQTTKCSAYREQNGRDPAYK